MRIARPAMGDTDPRAATETEQQVLADATPTLRGRMWLRRARVGGVSKPLGGGAVAVFLRGVGMRRITYALEIPRENLIVWEDPQRAQRGGHTP